MADDIFKGELLLNRSVYNTSMIRKDMEAVAQIIQNIMIYERGNYPNHPDLGFGIENYQFELLDSRTLQAMETDLTDQLDRFLPSPYRTKFQIETITNNRGLPVLVFSFQVTNVETADVGEINILLGKDTQKRLLSKILI
jgi:hypothetical protein